MSDSFFHFAKPKKYLKPPTVFETFIFKIEFEF